MKKFLTGLAVFVLVIVTPRGMRVSADTFSGTGSGVPLDPYVIANCSQLQQIDLNLEASYVLGNDIDCSATNPADAGYTEGQWTDGSGFRPIGHVTLNGPYIWSGFTFEGFSGVLDGQNHTISNLFIYRETAYNDPAGYYVGLFSTISSGAEVKNLGLENVDISTPQNEVGALAGGLSGTVINVHSTGTVHGGSRVGGLVGVHADANNFPNSSPLVYSWNGSKYVYTDDVGAILPKTLNGVDVAGIDAKDVAPKDGKYSFRISEEYNEIVYYDETALMTFDHQPGYQVVEPINRSAGVADLRTVSNAPTNPLLSCVDDTGADCTDDLKSFDDKWSYSNPNGVYQKKNLNKYWILGFGDLAGATDVELLVRGARDYAASAQYPGNSVRSVQVKNAQGAWVEVYNKNQVGSDGSPRLRTLNMTGKFLTNDYHIKVAFDTFNANYFAVDTSPQVPFTAHTYHPDSASLAFNGFTDIDHTYYYNHDYSKVSPLPNTMFKNQYGSFTKYGDVTPLLSASDNHFVIMRSGDQLSVEFPYVPVPDGMERSFMLYSDVFYKHATNDNLGVLGQSAAYLPYNGMTSYALNMAPYPQTQENIEYQNTWNTRTYPGPYADAFRAGGSTIIDSYSTAHVSGSWEVGGLVGRNQKEIRHSYATGTVTGSAELGGLVGMNQDGGTSAWIHDSYARGNVGDPNASYYYVGGLVGMNYGTIERSYATGIPSVQPQYGSYMHGLVGYESGTVTDSFWDTETSGITDGTLGTGKTTQQMKSVATFTSLATPGLTNAWDFTGNPNDDQGTGNIWNISESSNDGYPFLTWQTFVPNPTVSAVSVTADSTGATISWTTDINASSKVFYSPYDGQYAVTPETDTEVLVSSHSVALSGLLPCTTYFYKVYSLGNAHNATVSSAASFTTAGCSAGSIPGEKILSAVDTSGATTTTLGTLPDSKFFSVMTPANFTNAASSVIVQVKALDSTEVLGSIGRPNNLAGIGAIVFDVKALIDATTTVDSFDLPVTVSYHYSDADVAGLNESTLAMYHYHNGAWLALDACSVDAAANVITCTSPSFSIFALFGTPAVAAVQSTGAVRTTAGGTHFGCKDPRASNYDYFSASKPDLCAYSNAAVATMPVTSTTAHVVHAFSRNLKKGMKGADVRALQALLIKQNAGVAARQLAKQGSNGTFGTLTKSALIEFQKAKHIASPNGYFGPATRAVVAEL